MPKTENHKNPFSQTLIWICDKLESLNIEYMISGGSAVGFWGHIRTTMDIDIVVQISDEHIPEFIDSVAKEAYVDRDTVKKEITKRGMFNIVLNSTSFKIDLIVFNSADPYEKVKFERRINLDFNGKKIFVICPEDLIISKLKWSKTVGSSERQIRDCESILSLNRENIDTNYMEKWVKVLNLEEEYANLFK